MFHVASGNSGGREKAAPTTIAPRRQRKRIVLKFGSGILTRANTAGLDPKQIARLTAEVAALIQTGKIRGGPVVLIGAGELLRAKLRVLERVAA